MALHIGLALVALVFVSLRPATVASKEPPIPLNIVYLPAPDSGGGGGGGPMAAAAQPIAVAPHKPPPPVPTEPEATPSKPDPPLPTLDANVATTSDLMQFAGMGLKGLGGPPGPGLGPSPGSGVGSGPPGGSGGGPPGPGGDVTPPVPIVQVQPTYTTAAMVAKIQGVVRLLVVVRADGTVGDVKIDGSLDPRYGLDQEAVKAARAWKFKPGLRRGQPVDVQVVLLLEFRLH